MQKSQGDKQDYAPNFECFNVWAEVLMSLKLGKKKESHLTN